MLKHRSISSVAGVLSLLLVTLQPLDAGWKLFGNRSEKRTEAEVQGTRVDQNRFTLEVSESGREPRGHQPLWVIRLGQELGGNPWIGTTYKDTPYTEVEFNSLRTKLIEEEYQRLRRLHIDREKAKRGREEGAVIDDLLDDLLAGEEADADGADDEKYLDNFDEEATRRKVASKTFVPQSRPVVIPSLYVQGKNGALFCLEMKTGLTSWVLGMERLILTQPYESEKFIFIVDGATCKIVDKRSGYIMENLFVDRAIHPKVYYFDNTIFGFSYDSRVLAWKRGRRYSEWAMRLPGKVTLGVDGHDQGLFLPLDSGMFASVSFDGDLKWTFVSKSHSDEKVFLEKLVTQHIRKIEEEKKKARLEGRPEDKLYIRKHEKDMAKVKDDLSNLALRTRGRYLAEPLVVEDSVIVGCTDFQLYRLSRYSGLPEWSYSCGAGVEQRAFHYSGWVWQRDDLGRLHRINFETGEGKVVLEEVDRIMGARGEGVIYSKNGRVRTWSPKVSSVIKGALDSRTVRFLASPDEGFLMMIDRNVGEIRGYSTETFRALR